MSDVKHLRSVERIDSDIDAREAVKNMLRDAIETVEKVNLTSVTIVLTNAKGDVVRYSEAAHRFSHGGALLAQANWMVSNGE